MTPIRTSSTPITNIDDLRRLAERRCPRAMFDYVESGSYDEITLTANRDRLKRAAVPPARADRHRPAAAWTPQCSARRSKCRSRSRRPASTGLVHGDGEIHGRPRRRGRGHAVHAVDHVDLLHRGRAGAVTEPFWFQLYVFRDRGFSEDVIARALAAQCRALCVTVDLPHARPAPRRHPQRADRSAARSTLRNTFDIATKPAWALRVLHRQAQDLRQYRGLSQGHAAAFWAAGATGRPSISTSRSTGATSSGSASCGPASWSSRASSTSRTRGWPRPRASTASSCPTTAAASSTARRRPSRAAGDRRGGRPIASRCCSTAASAPARTC